MSLYNINVETIGKCRNVKKNNLEKNTRVSTIYCRSNRKIKKKSS